MIEILVSTAVLSLVMLSVALVAKTGNGVFRSTQARDMLRQHAQQALDRVVDEFATASKSTFNAAPTAPFGSSTLDFRTPTGIAGSVISWSTKRRICWQAEPAGGQGESHHDAALANQGQVLLIRDVGLKTSNTTVLVSDVAALLEGETANGKDDNGNGLVDEKGLSFDLVGDKLTIRMTLAELGPDGQVLWVTAQTQVRLRN